MPIIGVRAYRFGAILSRRTKLISKKKRSFLIKPEPICADTKNHIPPIIRAFWVRTQHPTKICFMPVQIPDNREDTSLVAFTPCPCHSEIVGIKNGHTADLITDYQTRRMNTKIKRADGSIVLAHTSDATALSQRPIIAIIENNQTAEGDVIVPEVLRPYLGGREKL
jgi:hypothetical protein